MKIDLSKIDKDKFRIVSHKLGDEIVYLVNPTELELKWAPEQLIFRSSVWDQQGNPVSLSFKKFFNWGENENLIAPPTSIDNIEFYTKIDGSLLAVSKWHGHLIVRTRGTIDATVLENGYEIAKLKAKYPKAFEFEQDTAPYTRIFEWTTPTNKIILDYGPDPQLWLIGKIYHEDYRYDTQNNLDAEAVKFGALRPERHSFNSLSEMIANVEKFDGVEGVCVYYNNGQDIRKVKGLKYLAMHRFKSQATPKNVLQAFLEMGRPDYNTFKQKFIATFDYECFQYVEQIAKEIYNKWSDIQSKIDEVKTFIADLPEGTRKDHALKITEHYKGSQYKSIAFTILSGKQPSDSQIKVIFDV